MKFDIGTFRHYFQSISKTIIASLDLLSITHPTIKPDRTSFILLMTHYIGDHPNYQAISSDLHPEDLVHELREALMKAEARLTDKQKGEIH